MSKAVMSNNPNASCPKLDRCLTQPVPGQKTPFLHGFDTEYLHRKVIWKRGHFPDRVFGHDGVKRALDALRKAGLPD